VVVLGCAQKPEYHFVSKIVHFLSKNVGNLAELSKYIPVDVFQGINCGNQVRIPPIVSCSVVVLGCAQKPEYHFVSKIVHFLSMGVGNLAESSKYIPVDVFQGISCEKKVNIPSVMSCLVVLLGAQKPE
jgi:hypothetical protein